MDEPDLCIIGAGAAGMELAIQLKDYNVQVYESGAEEFDFNIQKLSRFKQTGRKISAPDYSTPFDIHYAKEHALNVRQLGGTLNIWGRQFKLLDPIDLLSWPLDYNTELLPYYRSVALDYELPELLDPQKTVPLYKMEGFHPAIIVKKAYPFDLKNTFRSLNPTVFYRATVVEVCLTEDLRHVDHLVVRNLQGQQWKVKARYFVLACGALENARLLLASHKQIQEGIGNGSGWVGRNLLDHPKGSLGIFVPFQRPFQENYQQSTPGNRFQFEMELKDRDTPHHCIMFKPMSASLFKVILFMEQLPNRKSCLYLTEELDELNMPRMCLDWQLKEEDFQGFNNFMEKLRRALLPLGRFSFPQISEDLDFLQDASHQMGTTRMADRPQEGVVDKNGQVFGIDNLYLTGSSIFPTGGNANPTMTIFALVRRLADHLKGKL